ncbi:DP protein [Hordeum vulgare]|nr:DP protein [Hordeum vulgare]
MEAMEELSQLSESIRQAASLLADDGPSDDFTPRRPSNFLNAVVLGNVFDEKNIRRGVYDAFNVLIALCVIAKEKKEIRWMGLSNYRYEKLKKLEEVRKELVNKIRHKKALLQEIEKQFDDLQNIKLHNETLQSSAENVNGIRLPFVLVKITLVLNLQSDIPMFTTVDLM